MHPCVSQVFVACSCFSVAILWRGHCRCLQLPATRHNVWISAIILNFHHTFCGTKSRNVNHMLEESLRGHAHLETVTLLVPTLTLSASPFRQIYNFVCLYQGYSWMQRRAAQPKINRPTPFRRASPFPLLENSFTRGSGYRRTDHCAGAPVHMSQHDQRVSQHACQLTFPTLCANARGSRGERRRKKGEK